MHADVQNLVLTCFSEYLSMTEINWFIVSPPGFDMKSVRSFAS